MGDVEILANAIRELAHSGRLSEDTQNSLNEILSDEEQHNQDDTIVKKSQSVIKSTVKK